MKQDALSMSLLYDYYGELLTQKQQTCFDLYYNQDLTLSEIADELGVTRQGVHDLLSRATALLQRMEDKTGCIARAARIDHAVEEILSAARDLSQLPDAANAVSRIRKAVESIKE